MKRPKKEKRMPRSEGDVSPNIMDADSVIPTSVCRTHNEIAECDRETRNARTMHLHDLLNALCAAAMQIELASTEKFCPEEVRETLEQIGSHILEAMEIASRASTLIDSSPASVLADSPASHCDPP